MNSRENYLRAVRFEKPDYIPISIWANPACFEAYEHEQIFDLMETHPLLFPGFKRPVGREYVPEFGPVARKDEPFLDDFGCLWKTSMNGITGTVVSHPLANWEDFPAWKSKIPDPERCTGLGPIDWNKKKIEINEKRKQGELINAGLRHGHTFLQLSDLRGYENLLYDFADDEKNLWELIEILETFNMGIVKRYIEIGVDTFGYADDLGMQKGPMVSPEDFRKYLKPSYTRLMKPARDRGVPVHMHSDGDIRDLVDDLIDGGVEIMNLQDLVNGIDFIRAEGFNTPQNFLFDFRAIKKVLNPECNTL